MSSAAPSTADAVRERAGAVATSVADALRDRGNAAFKAGQFEAAVAQYTKALQANPRDAKSWNNRAQAYLKLDRPLLAWGDAFTVHDSLEPANFKALMRMAAAEEAMYLFDHAMATYAKCEELKLDAAEAAELALRSGTCTAVAEAAAGEVGHRILPSPATGCILTRLGRRTFLSLSSAGIERAW